LASGPASPSSTTTALKRIASGHVLCGARALTTRVSEGLTDPDAGGALGSPPTSSGRKQGSR